MSGHTPGPWRDLGTMPSKDDPDNGERFIGQVLIGRDYGYGVACALPCGTPDKTPARTAANARLIAAAPDLLGSVERAGVWISDIPHGDNCHLSAHYDGDPGNQCNCGKEGLLDALQDVIAKATRAQP